MSKTLKVINGDMDVSKDEFKREMEQLLQDNGKLNSVSQTMVNKIIDLFDTAKMSRQAILEQGGVLIAQEQANGAIKMVANPAVSMQSQAISGMSKLIAQLELDKLSVGGDDFV